jgi:hypothetical protein
VQVFNTFIFCDEEHSNTLEFGNNEDNSNVGPGVDASSGVPSYREHSRRCFVPSRLLLPVDQCERSMSRSLVLSTTKFHSNFVSCWKLLSRTIVWTDKLLCWQVLPGQVKLPPTVQSSILLPSWIGAQNIVYPKVLLSIGRIVKRDPLPCWELLSG